MNGTRVKWHQIFFRKENSRVSSRSSLSSSHSSMMSSHHLARRLPETLDTHLCIQYAPFTKARKFPSKSLGNTFQPLKLKHLIILSYHLTREILKLAEKLHEGRGGTRKTLYYFGCFFLPSLWLVSRRKTSGHVPRLPAVGGASG